MPHRFCQSLLFAPIGASRAQDATAVRVLLAFDKNANVIKFEETRGTVIQLFQNMVQVGLPVSLSEINVQDVSSESILRAVARFQVAPDETFVFYYHGHGGTDPEYGHFLNPRGGAVQIDLLRSQLREAIAKKNARCSILLTDCCSSTGMANIKFHK